MFGYIYKKDAAAIAVILAFCLLAGSFFDYQISSALFNIGSMYGRFIEAAGELPFELTASIAGVMLVRAVRPDSRGSKWLAVLGILVNVGLAGYEIVSSLKVGGKLIAVQLVLTFVLVIAANLIVYRLTRTTESDELTRWALMVLAVWVAQAIILNVIVKPLWSRPRNRGHAGAHFSAVVGNRQSRQVDLYRRRRDQGRVQVVRERAHRACGDWPYARRASRGSL